MGARHPSVRVLRAASRARPRLETPAPWLTTTFRPRGARRRDDAGGVRRVHVLAWRDLDDPDAGGSEVHADEFMRRWAAAGLDITHRTSAAVGQPVDGDAQRLQGHPSRQSVLGVPARRRQRVGAADGCVRRAGRGVERGAVDEPGVVPQAAHHVPPPRPRTDVGSALPRPLAGVGRALEARFAPPFYRRTLTLTPSDATRDDLLGLGFRAGSGRRRQQRRRPDVPARGRTQSVTARPVRRPTRAGEAAGRADRGRGDRSPARRRTCDW